MDMIGHHHPRPQMVTLTSMMKQVMLNNLCNAWIAKMTGALSGIQPRLDLFPVRTTTFIIGIVVGECLPLGAWAARPRVGNSQFLGEFTHHGDRQGVGQAIGDGLPHARSVEMREITAMMPSPV